MPVERSNEHIPVNTSKTNHEKESDWQTIGDLELPVNVSADGTVHAWLTQVLKSLNLSTEFSEKFLKSAQASVTRALGINVSIPSVYVHISIFVPIKHIAVGQAWGYFQIERIGQKTNDVNIQEHAIDFYLYVEGD